MHYFGRKCMSMYYVKPLKLVTIEMLDIFRVQKKSIMYNATVKGYSKNV